MGYAAKADATHRWITVQDQEGRTVSAYVRNSLAAKLGVFGKYGLHGDKVAIEGVYHQACSKHSGELEIHATSLSVLVDGYPVMREPSTGLGVTGVLMLALAAAVLVLERILRGRSRVRFLGIRL